ncbi:hypothetical protein J8G26_15725 [Acidovorax sp. JG5]|uniref:hypothetical protein n=1 Tax=Acidovorax sp. JG5 TaxID=2822718 RepID=UPI001B33149D|nr:hypothetical protein [Acidovorax sp. JG5]MBP3982174.1 hypothetical protein [Acidovorax sp. JG5]
MRLSAAVTILFFLLGCGHLARASECRTIRFNPGATSAKIQGAVQPEDQQCFRFGTGKGQSVRLAVQSKSGNVAFTINDVADNRDRIEFTSEKKVYELIVYQNLRSVTPDDFTLSLSIR